MKTDIDLKTERDKFVAFTFCWSDIIIELDLNFNIVFTGGAITPVTGIKEADLIGQPITDIIAESDHPLFIQVVSSTDAQNRIESVAIKLKGKSGPTPPIQMMGYRINEMNKHLFIGLRLGDQFGKAANFKKDEKSGLYDKKSFISVAQNTIKSNTLKGNAVELTMLDMDELQAIANSLGNEDASHLMNSVGSFLKSSSIGGGAAGRLDENQFGIIHDQSLDVPNVQDRLCEMASLASGPEVNLANGLTYAINRFKNSKGRDFSISSLQMNMSELVGEAHKKISSFKKMVADREFFIAFQPIIGSRDGKIHHYECLARFRGENSGKSPYEYILFAEETGLIPEFDFAMAQAALQWLAQQPKGMHYSIAVNVSGYSVGDREYTRKLLNLLKNNPWAKGSLLLEITESSRLEDLNQANNFIQNIRKMGYRVCLDDFGAGASSFQYLSSLDVDIVKLDGSAIRNARVAPKGRSFLIALGNLCRDLKIQTIAEMIDDPNALVFVRECGINHVQGYLFGKPSPNIKDFDPFPNMELFSKRAISAGAQKMAERGRL